MGKYFIRYYNSKHRLGNNDTFKVIVNNLSKLITLIGMKKEYTTEYIIKYMGENDKFPKSSLLTIGANKVKDRINSSLIETDGCRVYNRQIRYACYKYPICSRYKIPKSLDKIIITTLLIISEDTELVELANKYIFTHCHYIDINQCLRFLISNHYNVFKDNPSNKSLETIRNNIKTYVVNEELKYSCKKINKCSNCSS